MNHLKAILILELARKTEFDTIGDMFKHIKNIIGIRRIIKEFYHTEIGYCLKIYPFYNDGLEEKIEIVYGEENDKIKIFNIE